MKLITHKTILLVVITLSLAFLCSPLLAQVYKTVDEDGNVTYTDLPPPDGSKPVELRPISVIEAPTYEDKTKAAEESAEGEEGKELSLRELRKQYGDFAIVAPQPDESVWYSESVISVAWNAGYQLQPDMLVTVSVDGKRQAATTEQIIAVTGLERGEHTVRAVLNDAKNRNIATAGPITFFIRQPGLYNRARRIPRGGS